MKYLQILCTCLLYVKGSLSQTGGDKVAYESQIQTEMRCDITGAELVVYWLDTTDGAVQMFVYIQGQANPSNQSTDFKHSNFDYAFVEGSYFNLLVNDVERSDGGVYDCVKTLDGGSPVPVNYKLFVEVAVTPVISANSTVIDDPFEVTVDDEYQLTCSAVGAKSVNPLQLMFSFEADGSGTVSDVDADSGLANYTKTVTYTPDEDDKGLTSVGCSITGYNSITEDENNVSHTVGLVVQYRPDCTLTETPDKNNCTNVTLTCSCNAVPAVAESDYYFYQAGSLILGTSGNTAAATVEENEPTDFSCYASNAIGDGDPANTTEDYLCEPSCTEDSCQNGGTCRDNPAGSRGGYTCECAEFYIGHDCEIASACVYEPCQNNGICQHSSTGENYNCTCEGPYTGKNCTLPSSETTSTTKESQSETPSPTPPEITPTRTNGPACAQNPCENGGICSDGEEDYICECPVEYAGKTCAEKSECFSVDCNGRGDCTLKDDVESGYTCTCGAIFTGSECASVATWFIVLMVFAGIIPPSAIIIWCLYNRHMQKNRDDAAGAAGAENPPSSPPVYAAVKKSKKGAPGDAGTDNPPPPPVSEKGNKPQKSKAVADDDPPDPNLPEVPVYGVPDKGKNGHEIQYADLDHDKPASNKVHQPENEPTQYAEVKQMENLV